MNRRDFSKLFAMIPFVGGAVVTEPTTLYNLPREVAVFPDGPVVSNVILNWQPKRNPLFQPWESFRYDPNNYESRIEIEYSDGSFENAEGVEIEIDTDGDQAHVVRFADGRALRITGQGKEMQTEWANVL